MRIFFKYLRYDLKRNTMQSLVLTIISLLLVMLQLPERLKVGYIHDTNGKEFIYYDNCSVGLNLLIVVLGIICFLIPILQLSSFKNKQNIDTLFSVPLSRLKLGIVHYISGFIQIFFIYGCTFFTAFFYLLINSNYFALEYMLLFFPVSLGIGVIIYSIFSFIFVKANTLADGIIMCLAWILLLSIVLTGIYHLTKDIPIDTKEVEREVNCYLYPECLIAHNHKHPPVYDTIIFPLRYTDLYEFLSNFINTGSYIYAPLYGTSCLFTKLIEINGSRENYYSMHMTETIIMLIFWTVIGIASAIGYFKSFAKCKADKINSLSTTWFGYKLIIPLYGYSIIIANISNTDNYIQYILVLIGMLIAYIIYRRSLKIKICDIICLVSSLVPFFLPLVTEII